MASIFKDKRGLSQVVTTLILLVVSILLAGVVTFYVINTVSTQVQQEEVNIKNSHIWVRCSTDKDQAAFVLQNLGGRDIVIDKLEVRGVEVPWSSVYVSNTTTGASADLNMTNNCEITGDFTLTIEGSPVDFNSTSKRVAVPSGNELIIYIDQPDNVSCDDVGVTLTITVYTTRACYIEAVNVKAATT